MEKCKDRYCRRAAYKRGWCVRHLPIRHHALDDYTQVSEHGHVKVPLRDFLLDGTDVDFLGV